MSALLAFLAGALVGVTLAALAAFAALYYVGIAQAQRLDEAQRW